MVKVGTSVEREAIRSLCWELEGSVILWIVHARQVLNYIPNFIFLLKQYQIEVWQVAWNRQTMSGEGDKHWEDGVTFWWTKEGA